MHSKSASWLFFNPGAHQDVADALQASSRALQVIPLPPQALKAFLNAIERPSARVRCWQETLFSLAVLASSIRM